MKNSIKLQTDSVLHVPFHKYAKDFVFIVNSERYETSSFYADLISQIISSFHMIDPTISEFSITMNTKGDFSKLLSLSNFKTQEIDPDDVPFFIEALEKLGSKSVDLETDSEEITNDNIFSPIKQHQTHRHFFKSCLSNEIKYASRHFFELIDSFLKEIKLKEIDCSIIEAIISHQELRLNSENQLLKFVDAIYKIDSSYSYLYEFVFFENVSCESMKEFTDIFDMNDLTSSAWNSIVVRLQRGLVENEKSKRTHQYAMKQITPVKFNQNYAFMKAPQTTKNGFP